MFAPIHLEILTDAGFYFKLVVINLVYVGMNWWIHYKYKLIKVVSFC